MIWTDALRQRLADLWKANSAKEVVKIFKDEDQIDVTRNAVIGAVRRQNLGVGDKTAVHPMTRSDKRPADAVLTSWKKEPVGKRETSRVSQQTASIRCMEIIPRYLTLDQLEDDTCRYPVNEGGPYLFCGNQVRERKNMCGVHYDLCWVPAVSTKEPGKHAR